jgi:hypothetical protein
MSTTSGEEIEEESDAGEDPDAAAGEGNDAHGDFDFVDDEDSADDDEAEDDAVDGLATGNDASAEEKESPPETSNIIADSWRTSVVTFTHARVQELLIQEYNPKTRKMKDCALFSHDMNESKVRIVEACVQILATDIADQYDMVGLIYYARYNWPRHLADIDFGEVGSPLAVKLACTVARLFVDGESLVYSSYGHLNDFTATWFESPKYIEVVRRLISDHVEYLEEHQQEWASRVRASTRALFEGMVAVCSKIWLTKTGFDDPAYLDKSEKESWLLYAFNSLVCGAIELMIRHTDLDDIG